jgi:hypothetical protein
MLESSASQLLPQLLTQAVVDVQQVMRVLGRVVEHFGGEGAHAPVAELVLFVGVHAAVHLQQVCEGERGVVERLRSHVGIKTVHRVQAEVAL